MNFYDVIAARHTVREFSEKPVAPEALERILGAGLMAPSNDHLRNWEFVILEGEDKLRALEGVRRFVSGLPENSLDRWPAGSVQQQMYAHAMPRQYTMLAGAPVVILPFFKANPAIWEPRAINHLNTLAGVWCCIENILLAAAAEGMGCALRIPVGEGGPALAKQLGAPEGWVLPCYIGLGWPAPEDRRPAQVPVALQDKLHKGTW